MKRYIIELKEKIIVLIVVGDIMVERRNKIVELINSEGAVSFAKLKASFPDVSEMTLRNDLKSLDEANLIVRIHGGAKSVERVIGTDDLFYKRSSRNMDKKKQIAEKANKLIHEGTSIFLDSGSTATELARVFPDGSYLVFTTGLTCALELAQLSKTKTHLIGGSLNPASLSVTGISCFECLERLKFNIAFLGVTGFTHEDGFNCGADDENWLKRSVIKRSEKKVLLLDSSKIGIENTFIFASLKEIDVIISDDELDPELVRYFKSSGIEVY